MKIFLILLSVFFLVLTIAMFVFAISQLKLMLARSDSKQVPKGFDTSFFQNSPLKAAIEKGMSAMESLPNEDLYITSFDGLKLHAYFYPCPEKSSKFVLGIHGFKSGPRREFAPYIEYYHSKGYNLVIPDDRGHWKSEGNQLGMGVLDRTDCKDWAVYMVEKFGENIKILLHGVSMGGATVAAASGEETLPEQVKGIICDCGYTSMYQQLKYHIRENFHMPVFPVANIANLSCKIVAGYDFKTATPVSQVAKSHTPTLFVHGENDKIVPTYMAEELYEACSAKKRLLIIAGAAHAESIAVAPEKYHKAIEEFLM